MPLISPCLLYPPQTPIPQCVYPCQPMHVQWNRRTRSDSQRTGTLYSAVSRRRHPTLHNQEAAALSVRVSLTKIVILPQTPKPSATAEISAEGVTVRVSFQLRQRVMWSKSAAGLGICIPWQDGQHDLNQNIFLQSLRLNLVYVCISVNSTIDSIHRCPTHV